MNIAIVGTGRVAAALGRGWAEKGHMVTFASRNPQSERADALLDTMPGTVSVRGRREAAINASTIVLAIPYTAVPDALAEMGDLANKVIVDCTNPIAPGLRPMIGPESSGAQEIARIAPQANVIKSFNTIGAEGMADPIFNGHPASMLICGDDLIAKTAVMELAADIGFAPVDAGTLSAARHLEALALLWIHLATAEGMGRDIAFRLETR